MSMKISRRGFIKSSALGLLGAVGVASASRTLHTAQAAPPQQMDHGGHAAMPATVGEVDHTKNGFNPSDILTDFDYGTVSTLENGQTLR